MKEAYQPSSVHDGTLKIFRLMRKNFHCATLAGTATLAAFLAAAATPAQAARHHHHHHSDSQTSSNDVSREHHHRHHHHEDSEEASAPSEHHHHRHHRHSDDSYDVASSSSEHHHHHRHHHYRDDVAYSAPDHSTHEQRWLAHVERYEEREAMIEAHHENVLAADRALASGNVVRAAEAFRGTPYVMGGTSRSGFDCSGFTRFILGRSAGVALPRTAEEQYYTGQPISRDNLEAGDLVFFRDTYRHGISHVGMYIGDGRFVHASNPSEGVTVSSLDEQYYINHWAGARRVIKMRSESGDM